MARELTVDECREIVLRQAWGMIDYWEHESRVPETRGKLEGLVFSICALLDGDSLPVPACEIRPAPHEDAEAYYRERGANWWPTGVDIGPLHDHFHKYNPAHVAAEKGE